MDRQFAETSGGPPSRPYLVRGLLCGRGGVLMHVANKEPPCPRPASVWKPHRMGPRLGRFALCGVSVMTKPRLGARGDCRESPRGTAAPARWLHSRAPPRQQPRLPVPLRVSCHSFRRPLLLPLVLPHGPVCRCSSVRALTPTSGLLSSSCRGRTGDCRRPA